MDINLPGWGVYKGRQYQSQLIQYLEQEYLPSYPHIDMEFEDEPHDGHSAISSFLENSLEQEYMKMLFNDCKKEEQK